LGFGGMYWTVDAKLGDEVDDYMRWVRGRSNLMPRHAGPIAKTWTGGSSNLMPRLTRDPWTTPGAAAI